MNDRWVAHQMKPPRVRKQRNFEWGWYAFVTLYIGVGVLMLWVLSEAMYG